MPSRPAAADVAHPRGWRDRARLRPPRFARESPGAYAASPRPAACPPPEAPVDAEPAFQLHRSPADTASPTPARADAHPEEVASAAATVTEAPPALARLAEVPPPDDPLDGVSAGDGPEEPPFGLPVLAEVPELAAVLQNLRQVDRLLADVVDGLMLLEDTGLAASVTGAGIDTWLSIVGRRTGADTRMLRTTASTMRRIPTLHAAFRAGTVSWAQVRSVVLAVRPLPRHLDDRIDAAVADGIEGLAGAEPDALTRAIRWHLAALDPPGPERTEREAVEQQYLAMQPRLDGSGGRFWGECGPEAWAALDAALNTPSAATAQAGGCDDGTGGNDDGTGGNGGNGDGTGADGDGTGAVRHGRAANGAPSHENQAADADRRADANARAMDANQSVDAGEHPIRTAGRARLDRLIDHLEFVMAATAGARRPAADAGTPGATRATSDSGRPGTTRVPGGTAASPSAPARSRMQLLLRTSLSTLLDRDRTPASLLTTLLGGHVRVTAATARRLIDERGADLRTVIIDDTGAVVGVGRRNRIAPGWLTDATLALHDTCSFPGCEVAARACQTDHARPWHPARPGDPSGRTDIDDLAPGCGRHNRAKEPDGWVVTQRSDGTRRWHHPRSGLATTTVPVPG